MKRFIFLRYDHSDPGHLELTSVMANHINEAKEKIHKHVDPQNNAIHLLEYNKYSEVIFLHIDTEPFTNDIYCNTNLPQ